MGIGDVAFYAVETFRFQLVQARRICRLTEAAVAVSFLLLSIGALSALDLQGLTNSNGRVSCEANFAWEVFFSWLVVVSTTP